MKEKEIIWDLSIIKSSMDYLAYKKAYKKKHEPKPNFGKVKLSKELRLELFSLKTKDYMAFLHSKYWKFIRARVLKRGKFRCSICKDRQRLLPHHKTYHNHFNEHNHLGDLVCLCKTCHENLHGISPEE